MIRTLKAPSNPEILGRVIAALRVHIGQRRPKNASERALATTFNEQRIANKTAKRLVANFDGLPKGVRERLLPGVSKPGFVPSARAEAPPLQPLRVGMPAAAMVRGSQVRGALDAILSTDPGATRNPLYTVRYQGIFCQGETSWDRGSTSDEVYVITSMVSIDANGINQARTERHPQGQPAYYGDMDTLSERYGPVAATWQGYSEHPVSLTAVVFEHDEGDPDAYRDEVEAIVKAAIAVLSKLYPPAAVLALLHDTITDAVNWLLGTGDDIIGTETVVLPQATLELYAALQWSFYIGTRSEPIISGMRLVGFQTVPHSTNLPYHFFTTHRGSGATYVVAFDVERKPSIERPVVLL